MIRPLDDRIAVRKLPDEQASALSLIQFQGDAQHIGEVMAIGPGRRYKEGTVGKPLFKDGSRRPMSVKVGDIVTYGRYTDYDAEGVALIQEGDVIGIHAS